MFMVRTAIENACEFWFVGMTIAVCSRGRNRSTGLSMRDTTAISELTGEPVSTWSEEWRHECELRAVLAMSKSEREVFFNGDKEAGNRGVIAIRGPQVAERLRQDLQHLEEIRSRKKTP